MIPEHNVLVAKRYKLLEPLGQGGMGIVYRAVDRLMSQTVALKRVTTSPADILFASGSDPSLDSRLALAREFRTLASLRHPHIISVLDYGFDETRQPFFTMDLLENAQSVVAAGVDRPLEVQIQLILQILYALAYLHRRGILHRDLKPSNVLVANDQVKLVDFGLSSKRGQETGLVGTVAYFAPEMLQDNESSEVSDLYAVGVMAYEIFAGQFPYNRDKMAQLMQDIVSYVPNVFALPIKPELAQIIQRLLEKRPEDRYQSAEAVIAAFSSIADTPIARETNATRESFLQAAEFIGREKETEKLSQALQQAKQKHGSCWLIGGESGVGKSRLVNEIRTIALVEGMVVLYGQSVSERTLPYQLWIDITRWLVVATPLSDYEASVLKLLIPNISAILERPVPEAPEVDSQATQERLLSVIEALFERQQQPIAIILEDLQWAGKDSLDAIRRLSLSMANLPLVIIASYRVDERADLPNELPGAAVIRLERLNSDNIADLSASMIGSAGRNPRVVDLLQRETEGNVFFLIEVVRVLAEESGGLGNIGLVTLPRSVFAGGMKIAVRRRLDRVPAWAQHLLVLAATAGRQLDERLLASLASGFTLDDWLTVCSDAAVLDVQDGVWRFAHDKLREGLLADRSAQDETTHHREIAEAIEHVYADSPDQFITLAFHWQKAGNAPKEYVYSVRGGKYALEKAANEIAINLLLRAVQLGPRTQQEYADLESLLTDAYYGLGSLDNAIACAQSSLRRTGWYVPNNQLQEGAAILKELLEQILHRLLSRAYANTWEARHEAGLRAVRLYLQLSVLHYFKNDSARIIFDIAVSLNMAERIKPTPELARAYAAFSLIVGLAQLHKAALDYQSRSFRIADEIDVPPTLMRWILVSNAVYLAGVGAWEKVYDYSARAEVIALTIGEWHSWAESMPTHGISRYMNGQFETAEQFGYRLYRDAVPRNEIFMILSGLATLMLADARLGKLDDVIRLLPEVEAYQQKLPNPSTDLALYSAIALVYLRSGQKDLARKTADKALVFMKEPTVNFYHITTITAITEVYLTLWAQGDQSAVEPAKQALKSLRGMAFVFPAARPAWQRMNGHANWLAGKQPQAKRLWESSLKMAQKLDMPYDVGAAHLLLARADEAGRADHMRQAIDCFERIGAIWDVAQAQETSGHQQR